MKNYVHARLTDEDKAVLEELRKVTGEAESELVRKGLRLVLKEIGRRPSALELAGDSVGKFRKGPRDLARNKKHLEGFGR
jgi:Arc/MetJ-type ribon-helix-helix transcriptional regulator